MSEKQWFEVFSPKSCEVMAVPTILKMAIIGVPLYHLHEIQQSTLFQVCVASLASPNTPKHPELNIWWY